MYIASTRHHIKSSPAISGISTDPKSRRLCHGLHDVFPWCFHDLRSDDRYVKHTGNPNRKLPKKCKDMPNKYVVLVVSYSYSHLPCTLMFAKDAKHRRITIPCTSLGLKDCSIAAYSIHLLRWIVGSAMRHPVHRRIYERPKIMHV